LNSHARLARWAFKPFSQIMGGNRAFLWRYAPVRRPGKWKWRNYSFYVIIVLLW